MFRSAGSLPTRQNSSFRRLKRLNSSDRPLRAAVSRRNGTLRNITVFSHGYENISAAVPGEKQAGDKDGREMPAAEIFLRGVGYERGKREERRDKGYGMRELKILPKYKLYDIKIGGRGVYNGIRDIVIFWKNI